MKASTDPAKTPPAMPSRASGLMKRREAAEYLGVAEQTLAIDACASAGNTDRKPQFNLPVVKIGGRCFYRKQDLDDLIERSLITPKIDEVSQ